MARCQELIGVMGGDDLNKGLPGVRGHEAVAPVEVHRGVHALKHRGAVQKLVVIVLTDTRRAPITQGAGYKQECACDKGVGRGEGTCAERPPGSSCDTRVRYLPGVSTVYCAVYDGWPATFSYTVRRGLVPVNVLLDPATTSVTTALALEP